MVANVWWRLFQRKVILTLGETLPYRCRLASGLVTRGAIRLALEGACRSNGAGPEKADGMRGSATPDPHCPSRIGRGGRTGERMSGARRGERLEGAFRAGECGRRLPCARRGEPDAAISGFGGDTGRGCAAAGHARKASLTGPLDVRANKGGQAYALKPHLLRRRGAMEKKGEVTSPRLGGSWGEVTRQ